MALDFKKNAKAVTKVMKNASEDMNNKKRDIDVELIDLNPDNENIFGHEDIDYMAEAIKEDGFAGAIEVYALDNGRYEISSGHRRFLAARKLGHKTIPAIVSEDVDEKTKAKKLIKSNILNRKLTAIKVARALDYYKKNVLFDFKGEKTKELARVFNLSHTQTKRYLQLLNLRPEYQVFADSESVPYTNLMPLTTLDQEDQKKVYERLQAIYPDTDNVFTSATSIQVQQYVNQITQKDEKSKPSVPTVEQVQNRIRIADEAEADREEPTPVMAPVSYEERALGFEQDYEEKMAEAKVIDNQLTFAINSLTKILSTDNLMISDEVRKNAIEQLSEALKKLKK